ncbi:MAG: type 2 isopentenyl-diphosphate Delta-isomerase [Anaerolineales bacterium]
MPEVTPTSARKSDHIRVNLEEDVQSGLSTGLEAIQLEHDAVPELDFAQVDSSLTWLGRTLQSPLLISSMTGGTEQAARINRALAEAAQQERVAMGLGSQRAALEDPSQAASFQVRPFAPDILLFANLGAVQLNYGYGLDHCQRAVDMIEADALVLHFNCLQEALQPEGDVNFSGLLSKIEAITAELPVPVIAKEVGWGISAVAAHKLADAGVAAIDVAGAGGTSWSQVEMHRAGTERQRQLAARFLSWGLPTATALQDIRAALPELPLIASGGLRSGLDIAKCIALGATLGGMASPFLKAATISTDAVVDAIQLASAEIRICMFATGSATLADLANARTRTLP